MRKGSLIAALFAMTLFSLGTFVQAGDDCDGACKGDKGKGKGHMERMAKMLGLSDAQKEQVKAIREQYRDQIKNAADKEAKKAVCKEMREAIKDVLTAEQQQKMEQCKKDKKGKCEGEEKCDGKGKCDGKEGKCKGKGKKGCDKCED